MSNTKAAFIEKMKTDEAKRHRESMERDFPGPLGPTDVLGISITL
jgi:hypothetical protein